MDNILIRNIVEKDNPHLARIIRFVFEEHNAPRTGTVYSDPATENLFELFQNEKSVLWIAELNGEVVGCCGIFPTQGLENGYAELVKCYIMPKARGKGLGKLLITKCMKSAKEMGYDFLYLESLPQFSKAVTIYNKLGFELLSGPLGNSGHTSCSIWMIKEL